MTTEIERAVIEAARSLLRDLNGQLGGRSAVRTGLANAMAALDAANSAQEQEVEWSLVAESDEVKSIKNGKFYPVLSTLRLTNGVYRITIRLGEAGTTQITRPSPAEPRAIVRRGATGRAVDMFISSSGSM